MSKPTRAQRAAADRSAMPALGDSLRQYTEMLRRLFNAPVRITVVIRIPGLGARGDIVFGDDEPGEAVAAVQRVIAEGAAAGNVQ